MFKEAGPPVNFIGAAIAPGYAMTLTLLLTVLAVWFVISIPAALVIASIMRVQAEASEDVYGAEVEPVYRKTA